MKEYRLIGMSEEEFRKIVRKSTSQEFKIDYDMGLINIEPENDDNIYEEIFNAIKKEFGVDNYFYMFTSDTDQRFPEEIMIILK